MKVRKRFSLRKFRAHAADYLVRNPLFRAAATLASGAAVAHGITAASLPFVTRVFSPQDFSVLAVFSSMVAIVSVVACLRFEIAIPLPEDDRVATHLFLLAVIGTVLVTLGCGAAIGMASSGISELVGRPDIRPYLSLLPIAVLLSGFYAALQCWYIRQKRFASIAVSRIAQSSAAVGTQLGYAAVASANPAGLISGVLLNPGSGVLVLGWQLLSDKVFRNSIRNANSRALWATYRAHDRFPKYSTWEALANSAAIQIPLLMIAAMASGPESGYLLLAMTVVQAPMSLVGTAIGQVFLSGAAEKYRRNELAGFTVDVLGQLNRAGVGPLLALGIASPVIFPIAFGHEWARSGELVAWMTPWFALQFLASPVSMALHVGGHQRVAFGLQVFGLIVRVLSIQIASILQWKQLSEAYALSGMVVYGSSLFFVLRCVGADMKEFRLQILRSAGVIMGWCFVGVVMAALGWAWTEWWTTNLGGLQ